MRVKPWMLKPRPSFAKASTSNKPTKPIVQDTSASTRIPNSAKQITKASSVGKVEIPSMFQMSAMKNKMFSGADLKKHHVSSKSLSRQSGTEVEQPTKKKRSGERFPVTQLNCKRKMRKLMILLFSKPISGLFIVWLF